METKTLVPRLKRIGGQVRGLQRMVEQGESCQDILTQLMAAGPGWSGWGRYCLTRSWSAASLTDCLPTRPVCSPCGGTIGITVDAQGPVYVADSGNYRTQVFRIPGSP